MGDYKRSIGENTNENDKRETKVGCTRVVNHPTQKHIILTGLEDGTITVWDLRNSSFPVTLFDAHTRSVSELAFHPDRPQHLFSCSASGQLWHWDTTKSTLPHTSHLSSVGLSETATELPESGCPWMSEDMKNRITVYSLLQNFPFPINTFDICKEALICGCDNEAIYLIKNLLV